PEALLRPGEALRAARRAPGARESVTGGVESGAALRQRDHMTNGWDDSGQEQWLESASVDLARGLGQLRGPRRVDVTAEDGAVTELEARRAVVIATGSDARIPPISGIESVDYWDSRGATSSREVPESLTVIGGGVVGVEMAQAWSDLGSRVTIVGRDERLLPAEEPFAGDRLRAAFKERGINVITGIQADGLLPDASRVITILDNGQEITSDRLLVAAGRKPRTESLGLDKVGLEPGKFIEVDDQMRAKGVDGGWLYAVGDVNGRALLTHMGKYQARILGDILAGKSDSRASADVRAIPRVIFTDPHVAAVGLTERRAKAEGLNVRTVQYPFNGVAGAYVMGDGVEGDCNIVIDEDSRTIVGATFVGPGASEMLHAATIAIAGRVSLDDLWHAVPAFPTVSEVWLRFLEEYGF
ncbi:MAG: dihydrolipoyl dehydrogenase family protein, partial [Chloroflexota bacterium]